MARRMYVTASRRVKKLLEINPSGEATVVDVGVNRRPDCQYKSITQTMTHAMPAEEFFKLAPAVM